MLQRSFSHVFLIQERNSPTQDELKLHYITLENIDELLKDDESVEETNSSDDDDFCSNNEGY